MNNPFAFDNHKNCTSYHKYSNKEHNLKTGNAISTAIWTHAVAKHWRASLIATLWVILMMQPSAGQAQLLYTTNNSTITITGYSGSGAAVTIPGAINGLPVTSITNLAFAGNTNVTSITVPQSITNIGGGAFIGCPHLTAITVDTLNTAYGSVDGVLFDRSQTTIIECPGGKAGGYTIPGSVTNSAVSAFYMCSSLTNVVIPDGVIRIGGGAFYGCSGLINVKIPNSVTNISGSVFLGCTNLTAINVGTNNPAFSSLAGILFDKSQTTLLECPSAKTGIYTVPDSVTNIAAGAFYGCSKMHSIIIPDSVTSIGGGAIYGCTSLTNITLPNGITNIGTAAFYECSNLASITIPDNVTSIGGDAFCGCTSLANIALPTNITSIGNGAFYHCTNLAGITIPESVTNIGSQAFAYCSSLKNIILPNQIISIGEGEFLECRSLTSITLPTDITSIGITSFYDCANLVGVSIPDGVTNIGSQAFAYCSGLTNITIPGGVANIGKEAFYACARLTGIMVDPSNLVYASSEGVLFNKNRTTLIQYPAGKVGNYIIPNTVTNIGIGAFYYCVNLSGITIPSSVVTIGNYAFAQCYHLSAFYFSGNAPVLGSYVLSGDNNARVFYLPGTTGWSATFGGLPASVWNAQVLFFDNFAQFANGTDLTSTNYIPASGPPYASAVTSVQDGSPTIKATNFLGSNWALFDNSVPLNKNQYKGVLALAQTNQTLQVTWKMWIQKTNSGPGMFLFSVPTDDPNANYNPPIIFTDTGSIVALTNGTSVLTPIGNWSSLAGTIMTNTLTLDYPHGSFSYSLNGQTLATLPLGPYFTNVVDAVYFNGFERSAGSMGNRFAIDDVKIQSVAPATDFTFTTNDGTIAITSYTGSGGDVLMPRSITGLPVTSIGYEAFYDCTNLTTITIPDSVTNIQDAVFSGCSHLTSASIPATVTSIGKSEFSGCGRLESFSIPSSVTNVGDYAFAGCFYPGSITIPGSVVRIGQGAFSGCGLKSVTIPNGVRSVGDNAFYYCRSLTNVTIADGVSSIGNWAFEDCTKLNSISIPGTVTNIGTAPFSACDNLTAILVDATNPSYSGLDGALFNKTQSTLICFPAGRVGAYVIPDTVTSVGDFAFEGCSELTNVIIDVNVTNIGVEAFSSCGLKNVTLPSSVISIGFDAFASCTNLAAINVDADNPTYSSLNGVLFDKSMTTLLQYPGGLVGDYTIPNGVTDIGQEAFSFCRGLTNIIIPDTVTNIGSGAFINCDLTSIMIGSGVTSIGNSAFSGCGNLTSVTVPASTTNIGGIAFEGCSSLASVYFRGNAPSAPYYPFGGGPYASVDNATAYYLPGTAGWSGTFGGMPTALWLPQIQVGGKSFGVVTNQFGFNINWASSQTVVVEASTNLQDWMPVLTNTLVNGTNYFSDPTWTNSPVRFYRLRSQ